MSDPDPETRAERAQPTPSTWLFHVTGADKLPVIASQGLIPDIGPRARALGEIDPCVYLFTSPQAVEDALMNWLGEQFGDGEPLAVIAVASDHVPALQASPGAEYEVATTAIVPPQHLRVICADIDHAPDLPALLRAAADADPAQLTLAQLKAAVVAAREQFDALHRATVKTPDMPSYFDIAADMHQTKKALAEAITALPDDGFMLEGATRDGRPLLLNASAQRPGYWQLTRFDSQGQPWGDTQYETKAQAVKEYLQDVDVRTLDTFDRRFTQPQMPQAAVAVPDGDASARLAAGNRARDLVGEAISSARVRTRP